MPRLNRNEWIAVGFICLGALWPILQVTGELRKIDKIVGAVPPDWLVLANLFFLPVVTAVLFLGLSSHLGVIVALGLLCLASWWLGGLAYYRYPIATLSVQLLALAEMYWIIPRYRKRWRGEKEAAPEQQPAKSIALNYVIYLAVALAVAGWVIYRVMSRR